MIRDHIKDEKYFSKYIKDQIARIEKFTEVKDKLAKNDVQKERKYNIYLANFYKDLFTAEYSAGMSVDELKSVFCKYLSFVNECGISSYDDTIDILSMSILFEINHEQVPVIPTEYMDGLSESLIVLLNKKKQEPEGRALLYPEYYQSFYDYELGVKSFEDFKAFMNNDWYGLNKDEMWYDAHLSENDIYVGYWCWLAAALMKIRGDMDNDIKYVPVDLI